MDFGCSEYTMDLFSLVMGDISTIEEMKVRKHLKVCKSCADMLADIEMIHLNPEIIDDVPPELEGVMSGIGGWA